MARFTHSPFSGDVTRRWGTAKAIDFPLKRCKMPLGYLGARHAELGRK
jgi:hypothetical protein